MKNKKIGLFHKKTHQAVYNKNKMIVYLAPVLCLGQEQVKDGLRFHLANSYRSNFKGLGCPVLQNTLISYNNP